MSTLLHIAQIPIYLIALKGIIWGVGGPTLSGRRYVVTEVKKET